MRKAKVSSGPSDVYISEKAAILPIKVGDKVKEEIKMSVVDANITCLIGRDVLEEWGSILDCSGRMLIVDKEFKVKLLKKDNGHLTIDMIDSEFASMQIRQSGRMVLAPTS